MRELVPKQLEDGRYMTGDFGSGPQHGFNGAFSVMGPTGRELKIIASSAMVESDGWEHVSISTRTRTPNWQEMCFVKNLCWDEEEIVVQFHPPASQHVNNHPYCLHLWKDARNPIPRMPPPYLVGIKSAGELRGPAHARQIKRDYDEGKIKE